jgi:hypothetical protein
MNKIRKLSKLLDRKIEHAGNNFDCQMFFKYVEDKELLTTIRKGGYVSDQTLRQMFERYKIK